MTPEMALAVGSMIAGFMGSLWLLLRDNRHHLQKTVVRPINDSNSYLMHQLGEMVANMKTASDTAIRAYAGALGTKSEQVADLTAELQGTRAAIRRH